MLSAIKKIVPGAVKANLKTAIYKIVKPPPVENSFAQAGEDRVLSYFFGTMGILQPTYLDVGANHPISGSNTYLFYQRGARGVCVEADPAIFGELARARPADVCLNVGITFDNRREADFYVFEVPALNTLSRAEAEYRERVGSYKIVKTIKIPLRTINEVIAENFQTAPDLLSIDVEGIDLQILESLDFDKYRPLAICVETITYSENRTERKIGEILDFVASKNYLVYADTHINTIFVDEKRFSSAETIAETEKF